MEAEGSHNGQNRKKVMVFYDGTWCGQQTGTRSNVKLLADAVAGKAVNSREPFVSSRDPGNIVGCYFSGEGVEGTFSDYLLDGGLGGRIKEDCLEAYRFVMEEFEDSDGDCEAWLVGYSRGAYAVRSVAGLINNCGLISRTVVARGLQGHGPSDQEMNDILDRAYHYYRDRTDTYAPKGEYMQHWKREHCRVTVRPPVKFMGLLDTVGSLGIPSLSPGLGVEYNYGQLNFYGNPEEGVSAVSGEVERVYQALAVHDRMSPFSPCHVKREKVDGEFSYNKVRHLSVVYRTEELWFPGSHIDIGRQRFAFYKSPKLITGELWKITTRGLILALGNRIAQRSVSFCLSRLLRIPDMVPNYDHSQNVLRWMAEKMGRTDPGSFGSLPEVVGEVVGRVPGEADSWLQRLVNALTFKPSTLSNDAFDHLLEKKYLFLLLVPFGHDFIVSFSNRYFLRDRTILDPLPATPPAPPVQFYRAPDDPEPGVDPDRCLKSSAEYRSRSFDSYMLERTLLSAYSQLKL